MKRILALAVMMCLLAGCAPAADNGVSQQPTTQQQSPAAPTASQEVQKKVLALGQEEITLQEHGQTYQLDSGDIEPAEILWSSENEAVAAVKDGVVTAVDRGETVITAQFEDQTVSCRVICDLPILPVKDPNAEAGDPVYLPPEVEIVDGSFFDDAVFVGDSQCLALYNCATFYNWLGNTTYLARNSYSVDSAANNKMLMSWRGGQMPLEDAIAGTGAKRVFIMLGINDVGHYRINQIPTIIANWDTMITKIREKSPDIQICIQSLPPVLTDGQTEKINNEIVSEYNAQLKTFAEENGCVFIDVAQYLVDSTGGMASVYCSDNFVHLNVKGIEVWVKVLKACTDYE